MDTCLYRFRWTGSSISQINPAQTTTKILYTFSGVILCNAIVDKREAMRRIPREPSGSEPADALVLLSIINWFKLYVALCHVTGFWSKQQFSGRILCFAKHIKSDLYIAHVPYVYIIKKKKQCIEDGEMHSTKKKIIF